MKSYELLQYILNDAMNLCKREHYYIAATRIKDLARLDSSHIHVVLGAPKSCQFLAFYKQKHPGFSVSKAKDEQNTLIFMRVSSIQLLYFQVSKLRRMGFSGTATVDILRKTWLF